MQHETGLPGGSLAALRSAESLPERVDVRHIGPFGQQVRSQPVDIAKRTVARRVELLLSSPTRGMPRDVTNGVTFAVQVELSEGVRH
jgi:hypothetical protein